MLTPVKSVRGQTEWDKQFNKAADDLFSKAVSSVKQPIGSLFNQKIPCGLPRGFLTLSPEIH